MGWSERADDVPAEYSRSMRIGAWSSAAADDSAARTELTAWWRYAAYAALAAGAALRIAQYVAHSSLSIDESFLSLDLLRLSPGDLLGRLDFNQAAPLGFLEVEKAAVAVFGTSEYALRLLPMLASLLSLPLFYHAAKKLLDNRAVPFACAAFVLLDPLIYYGATIKQYSFDITAAVALYAVAASIRPGQLRRRQLVKLAVLGAVIVWLSHASVFVLAAIALALTVDAFAHGRSESLRGIALTIGAWVVSFATEVAFSHANLVSIQSSFAGRGTFLGSGNAGAPTLFDSATSKARYLVGLEDTVSGSPILRSLPAGVNQGLTVLLVLVAATGVLALLRMGRSRTAMLLGLPPVFVLFAAALHQYPLVGRTLVFLMPAVALCLGEGMRALVSPSRSGAAYAGTAVSAVVLVSLALLPAVHLIRPRQGEGIRPALRDLGSYYRAGDALYVGHSAQFGVAYYHLCRCAPFDARDGWRFDLTGAPPFGAPAIISRSPALIIGRASDSSEIARADWPLLPGRGRVWILISQTSESEARPFLAYLDHSGRRVQQFTDYGPENIGALLYLYDLP